MFVGAALIGLHIPGARSLKDKRRVVKGLKDRLKNRHGVAVAEVDDLDVWQSAVILVSAATATEGAAREALAAVRRQADNLDDAECIRFECAVQAFEDFCGVNR